MESENILALLLSNGAAIIIFFIVAQDLLRRKPALKPWAKWISVLLLSLWQTGCWVSIDRFGKAFGNYPQYTGFAITLGIVVVCWYMLTGWRYHQQKKSRPD